VWHALARSDVEACPLDRAPDAAVRRAVGWPPCKRLHVRTHILRRAGRGVNRAWTAAARPPQTWPRVWRRAHDFRPGGPPGRAEWTVGFVGRNAYGPLDHHALEASPMHLSRRFRRALGAVALLGAALPILAACAASPSASTGSVAIRDAWIRPAAAGTQTAAYLTIANPGSPDVLLSARCTIAASTMLHQTTTDASGMTGMSMIDRLPIPAGATVELKPGGTHVMMTGLGKTLEAGSSVELELTFEKAGRIVVTAAVRPS
jgi:copper(I)-binding protein